MTEPFLKLKTGDPFITVEQFLVLPENSCYEHDRLWGVHMDGAEWVLRYKYAKEMWEKYGNEPPMDVDVYVTVNGHSTNFPELTHTRKLTHLPKRLLTKYSDEKAPYYYLIREEGGKSLLDKWFWWRSIIIP